MGALGKLLRHFYLLSRDRDGDSVNGVNDFQSGAAMINDGDSIQCDMCGKFYIYKQGKTDDELCPLCIENIVKLADRLGLIEEVSWLRKIWNWIKRLFTKGGK